jgi:hypothetical protein
MAVELTDLMIRGYATRTRKDLYESKVTGLILRVIPTDVARAVAVIESPFRGVGIML